MGVLLRGETYQQCLVNPERMGLRGGLVYQLDENARVFSYPVDGNQNEELEPEPCFATINAHLARNPTSFAAWVCDSVIAARNCLVVVGCTWDFFVAMFLLVSAPLMEYIKICNNLCLLPSVRSWRQNLCYMLLFSLNLVNYSRFAYKR